VGSKLAEEIFALNDLSSEVVEVPEWRTESNPAGKYEVRSMTALERARSLKSAYDPDTGDLDFEKVYPDLLIACVFDPETGEPLFAPADAEKIGTRNAHAVEALASVAMRLSGMTAEVKDEMVSAFPGGEGGA
jgi:hypothetical protein